MLYAPVSLRLLATCVTCRYLSRVPIKAGRGTQGVHMATRRPVMPGMLRWRCKHCGDTADLSYPGDITPTQPSPLFQGQCPVAEPVENVREHVWLIERSPILQRSSGVMWQCFHCGRPVLLPRTTDPYDSEPAELYGGACPKAQLVNNMRGHLWVLV